jgi:hypothetical protein
LWEKKGSEKGEIQHEIVLSGNEAMVGERKTIFSWYNKYYIEYSR